MPIVKKPKRNQDESTPRVDERAADVFISGAGTPAEPEERSSKKTPVMLRFDPVYWMPKYMRAHI